jgi:hypothetical protein
MRRERVKWSNRSRFPRATRPAALQLRVVDCGIAVDGPQRPDDTGTARCRRWKNRAPQGSLSLEPSPY